MAIIYKNKMWKDKKMKKYVVSIIILFIIIVLAIGGFFIYSNIMNNKSSDAQTLNEKGLAEIDYLNTNIITLIISSHNTFT